MIALVRVEGKPHQLVCNSSSCAVLEDCFWHSAELGLSKLKREEFLGNLFSFLHCDLRGCQCQGLEDLVLQCGLPTSELGRLSVSIRTGRAADGVR